MYYADLIGQENVLGESRMMIPDCRKRLEAALEDLKGILVHIFLVSMVTVYFSFLLFCLVMDIGNHADMFSIWCLAFIIK